MKNKDVKKTPRNKKLGVFSGRFRLQAVFEVYSFLNPRVLSANIIDFGLFLFSKFQKLLFVVCDDGDWRLILQGYEAAEHSHWRRWAY